MSVLAVHGVGNYLGVPPREARTRLATRYADALDEALLRTTALPRISPCVSSAYYAHHLRGTDQRQDGETTRPLDSAEVRLLEQWADAVGAPVDVAQGPAAVPLRMLADWVAHNVGRTDDPSHRRALAQHLSRFVRDVSGYMDHAERRQAARDEVVDRIRDFRPHVVIAHSLGSVVAYEALWTVDDAVVDLFVTLGSPLALPGGIFDRLQPPPSPDAQRGQGARPRAADRWTSISDVGDVVAVPRPLSARFTGISEERTTSLGFLPFHGFTSYLRTKALVRALAEVVRRC